MSTQSSLHFNFYFLFNLIPTLCHKVTYCLLLYHNVAYLAKHFSGCVGWKCTRGSNLLKTTWDTQISVDN